MSGKALLHHRLSCDKLYRLEAHLHTASTCNMTTLGSTATDVISCRREKRAMNGSQPDPLMIIRKAAPIPHLHHGHEAKHGLHVETATWLYSQSPSSQLDWLVSLSPGKLLLPYLRDLNE